MNKDNKRLIIIGSVAIAVIIVIVLIFIFVGNSSSKLPAPSASAIPSATGPSNTSDNTNVSVSGGDKINNSTKLAEEKVYKGMKVSNIKLIAREGKTYFSLLITNNSGADVNGHPVTIVFTDNTGTKVSTAEAYVGKVKNGGTTELEAVVTSDLSNAYNFTIEAKK